MLPLSKQDAENQVKALLAAFDVRGPFRVSQSGAVTRPPSNAPVLWHIIVTDPQSTRFEGYLAPDGSRTDVWRGAEFEFSGGMSPRSFKDARQEERLRRWLAGIGTKEPTRRASLTVDEKGIGRAYFPLLRNGYPFISYPVYGYTFRFRVADGAFLRLQAQQNPPPVASGGPKLDRTAALAALTRIWDAEVAPDAARRGWRRVWYTLTGEPELGYYLPKDRQTALLVWRISYMSHRDVGYAVQGGSNGMLIDAVTGNRIQTDTVP